MKEEGREGEKKTEGRPWRTREYNNDAITK